MVETGSETHEHAAPGLHRDIERSEIELAAVVVVVEIDDPREIAISHLVRRSVGIDVVGVRLHGHAGSPTHDLQEVRIDRRRQPIESPHARHGASGRGPAAPTRAHATDAGAFARLWPASPRTPVAQASRRVRLRG